MVRNFVKFQYLRKETETGFLFEVCIKGFTEI
jgi:hypothetical protein